MSCMWQALLSNKTSLDCRLAVLTFALFILHHWGWITAQVHACGPTAMPQHKTLSMLGKPVYISRLARPHMGC